MLNRTSCFLCLSSPQPLLRKNPQRKVCFLDRLNIFNLYQTIWSSQQLILAVLFVIISIPATTSENTCLYLCHVQISLLSFRPCHSNKTFHGSSSHSYPVNFPVNFCWCPPVTSHPTVLSILFIPPFLPPLSWRIDQVGPFTFKSYSMSNQQHVWWLDWLRNKSVVQTCGHTECTCHLSSPYHWLYCA